MRPENAQRCHRGEKTQTRRIVDWTKCHSRSDGGKRRVFSAKDIAEMNRLLTTWQTSPLKQCCLYGQIGDRLWVRENCWERPHRTPRMLREGADTWEPYYYDALLIPGEADELKAWGFRRRSSIYMPRWACRTVLEIMAIRVERVQEISEQDAKAEGAAPAFEDWNGIVGAQAFYKHGFKKLWESINGAGSWTLNPWVWVLSFQRMDV